MLQFLCIQSKSLRLQPVLLQRAKKLVEGPRFLHEQNDETIKVQHMTAGAVGINRLYTLYLAAGLLLHVRTPSLANEQKITEDQLLLCVFFQ